MGADVGQAQRPRVLDERAEHAVTARQVADDRLRLAIDPRGQEALEPLAAVVEDAERRVAGAGDLARHLEHALEQRVEVELGDHAAPDLDEASEAVFVHVGLARRHDT